MRDDGWINPALGWSGSGRCKLLYTDVAMYVGIVYAYLPFMILPLYARLSRRIRRWRRRRRIWGDPLDDFPRVTLPLSLPGVVAGLALVFIPAVGEYVIPEAARRPGRRRSGG